LRLDKPNEEILQVMREIAVKPRGEVRILFLIDRLLSFVLAIKIW
jgi:hypothetical protein